MSADCIVVTNGTGLTIHTAALPDYPVVVLGPGDTPVRRDAWEKTLECNPLLLLYATLTTSRSEPAAPVAEPAETIVVAPVAEAPTEPPMASMPQPQGKGKQRR